MTDLLHSPTALRLGWTLLHSLWQNAAVAALLAIFLFLIPKSAPRVRYGAATLALLATLLLPALTFYVMPPPNDPITANPDAEVTQPPYPLAQVPVPPPTLPSSPITLHTSAADPLTPPTPLSKQLTDFLAPSVPRIVPAWLVGILLLTLYNLGGWLALQRVRSLRTAPVPDALLATLSHLAQQLRITRPVQLAQSLLITTPLVIGHLRPIILLPTLLLTGLTPDQLHSILAHELAHIRRHDYLVNLLQILIETLLFFHPAVWQISATIRREREHCCEDLAASLVGNKLLYAQTLLSLEDLRPPTGRLALDASGGHLPSRIQRLLLPQTRRTPAALAILLTALLLLAIPLGLSSRSASSDAQNISDTQPTPGTLITGTLLETGTDRPIPNARVDLNSDHDSRILTTDAAGHFSSRVPPGLWTAEFRQVSEAVYLSKPFDQALAVHEIRVDATDTERAITLHIPPVLPVGPIHGKLLMPDGSPAANLLLVPDAEDEDKQLVTLIYLDAKKTAADGSFSFKSAPVGEPVHLYAITPDHQLALAVTVTTAAHRPDQFVGNLPLQPTTSADLLVTDAHNQPLPNIAINMQPTFDDNGLGNMTRKFSTDNAGHLHPDGLLPGLHYKISRPKLKYHVNLPLVPTPTQPAATTAILDDSLQLHVRTPSGKSVSVGEITLITCKTDAGEWRMDFAKTPIRDRLSDGTVLIDPSRVLLAEIGKTVTMHFKSTDGLAMIATTPYPGLTGSLELVASTLTSPIELTTLPMPTAPDEYAGRILDNAGHPVAGATVAIPLYVPFIPNNLKTLATTDATGIFHIPAVAERIFYFQIDKPGYARRWLLVEDLPKGTPFNVPLDSSTIVHITTTTPDGAPAASTLITASTAIHRIGGEGTVQGFQVTATTDDAGHATLLLTPGSWEFSAASPAGQFQISPDVQVATGASQTLPMRLAPGIHLKVHTIDSATAKPVPNATLSFADYAPGAAFTRPNFTRTTDANGNAEWQSVMPGQQALQVAADGYARWQSPADANPYSRGIDSLLLNLTPATTDITITLEKGMRLTGTIADSQNHPVPHALVNVAGLQTGDRRYAKFADGQGKFSLLVPAALPYNESLYSIIVINPNDYTNHPLATSEPFRPVIGGHQPFTLTAPNPPR